MGDSGDGVQLGRREVELTSQALGPLHASLPPLDGAAKGPVPNGA